MDEDFNSVLQKDIFISSTASSDNDIALSFASFDQDLNFEDDFVGIKMEPSDETSDYHGSSSGSPSSSLSSPNNMKDEPLGLDINFCGSFSTNNFSPAPGSSHSPGLGMMNGGGPVSQQPSPLPPVSHFSHAHIQQSHQMGVPQMFSSQHQMHHTLPQYAGSNNHNFIFKDAMYYDGIGGMNLAAAQQQLKSRNKMHEMAVKQRLITDQVSETFPMSGDVQLSAEEKRTLIQEGYAVPSRYPLTKTEEEALKIVRRKIKNKLSAQESRRKRKEYMDALEIRVQGCVQENSYLKTRVRQLETANRELAMKLQAYEEREQSMRGAQQQ